ncbi:TetR/AcrR family transcriptional regulator C-terminal domain-containing protein [Allokutzneria sp. A3M-2-11 16]|uniref:TetR/AcrR family transcriptional regulator n=1 Tax=Allokutzneria sp. A3M-2-11 16 TaxID=2962043 RepID=UPI0020B72B7B|nr:TetR/AcrR family transcriptional regulator [Allokutzneria sp. A3M-2-11 16]MCP3802862.1 TetR/AcrR family transcriptional regulator C-terminal domain-containing protein [Allokutzneria sp. A3M-2-11 16]
MGRDQEPLVELLWGAPQKPRRGPKPALTVDQLVRAATAVADAEGLAAVSMQRVADELSFTKMSLYRYVPGKAELVALMIDRALGAPPDLTGNDWRERLRAWAMRMLTGFQAHRWLVEATVGPRVLGPNEIGWLESALVAMEDTGLDGGERLDAVALIAGHIRMIAQQGTTEQPERDAGMIMGGVLREHGARYPAVCAAMASAAAGGAQDQGLEFGIERILDGLGLLVDRRAD